MSDERGITRRSVLSGVATIGSIGAVSGVGAVGLFRNEAPFTGNLLAAGELNLKLCWSEDGEACTPQNGPVTFDLGELEYGETGTATIQCDIEDNPGWTWLRTNCPEQPCGVQDAVEISLWYDENCNSTKEEDENYLTVTLSQSEWEDIEPYLTSDIDNTSPIKIQDLELCDALTLLRFGTLLDADPNTDTTDPFEPGGWCCLGVEWEVVDNICTGDEFELTFEFYTQQWRHNPQPVNPWPEVEACTVDCTEECAECDQGISFVAFGIENGSIDKGDITLTPYSNSEGEVFKVDWEADRGIGWVVLFYGSNQGKYFENFHVNGDTSGTVRSNAPSDYADFDSKLLWEGGQTVTDYGQCPRDPCPDLDTADYGCGVRYNFESDEDGDWIADTWDSVCGQKCPCEDNPNKEC